MNGYLPPIVVNMAEGRHFDLFAICTSMAENGYDIAAEFSNMWIYSDRIEITVKTEEETREVIFYCEW